MCWPRTASKIQKLKLKNAEFHQGVRPLPGFSPEGAEPRVCGAGTPAIQHWVLWPKWCRMKKPTHGGLPCCLSLPGGRTCPSPACPMVGDGEPSQSECLMVRTRLCHCTPVTACSPPGIPPSSTGGRILSRLSCHHQLPRTCFLHLLAFSK